LAGNKPCRYISGRRIFLSASEISYPCSRKFRSRMVNWIRSICVIAIRSLWTLKRQRQPRMAPLRPGATERTNSRLARKHNVIVGLDLGTVKTCALVCKPNSEGRLEVAGLGVAESRGWRKGMIVNLDMTALAVKKALEGAEAAAGVSIESAYVGVAGAHIKGVNSQGGMSLGKSPTSTREVERDDMRQVS